MSDVRRKRRPKGDGTFRYRAERAIWEASFDLGKDHEGKRRRRVLYGKTRAELQRKIVDLRASSGGVIRTPAKGTVGEYVERWLRDVIQPNRRPKTLETYTSSWRLHAAPFVATVELEKFDVEHVAEMYRRLRERGTSASAVGHVARMLHSAFAVAIRRRIYTKANPFGVVEKPAHTPKEGGALTVDEARRFLEAARALR